MVNRIGLAAKEQYRRGNPVEIAAKVAGKAIVRTWSKPGEQSHQIIKAIVDGSEL